MNEMPGEMYNPQKPLELDKRLKITTYIEESVFASQPLWACGFAFDEDAPPSSAIIHARFRAQFWEAKVITYTGRISKK